MFNSRPVHFDICRIPVTVTGHDASFRKLITRRYGPFLTKRAGPRRFRFRIELKDDLLSSHQIPYPQVHVADGGRVACFTHHSMFADLHLRRRSGSAVLTRRLNNFDNFLRVFYTIVLAGQGGFLSHSAGLRIDRDAFLFPGKSGSGKSTLAHRAGVSRVLSDELTGVAWHGKRPVLMGTPFWGSFQKGRLNATCPLKGIFFLNKEAPFGCRAIDKDEAVVRLMGTILFFTDHPAANERLLAHASRLVQAVPTWEFNYDKNRERFPQIRERLVTVAGPARK